MTKLTDAEIRLDREHDDPDNMTQLYTELLEARALLRLICTQYRTPGAEHLIVGHIQKWCGWGDKSQPSLPEAES